MPAGGVQVGHSKTNGQVEVGVVVSERLRPNGHVKLASGVVGEREGANRHVTKAVSIATKRIGTDGGIVNPHRGINNAQRVNSHCCVCTCATIGWAIYCLELRRKRKPAQRNCQCKKTATQWRAVDGSYQIFHFFVYFVGCYPVERVNCPPVRTEPGIIRNDAIRRGAFSFIWL